MHVGGGVHDLGSRSLADDDYLARIHHTARLAETALDTVVDRVCQQLVGLLALQGCRFEYDTLIGHPPRLEEDGTISWGHRRWDASRDGLLDEEVELRVLHNEHFHGRFMLRPTPGTVLPLAARLVAVTLADQAGAAFETVGRASTADSPYAARSEFGALYRGDQCRIFAITSPMVLTESRIRSFR